MSVFLSVRPNTRIDFVAAVSTQVFPYTPGNRVATGMQFNYHDEVGESQVLRLIAPESGAKRTGMAWVAAMQKVIAQSLCPLNITHSMLVHSYL